MGGAKIDLLNMDIKTQIEVIAVEVVKLRASSSAIERDMKSMDGQLNSQEGKMED
jgi:hypothetical protein